MPEVIINDQPFEAEEGENLLNIARRNASVIGFLCSGRGVCQTCECRILAGAEHLSEPSEIELKTMTASRRRRGYRLACQTEITGAGPIKIISQLELLRRQTAHVIQPPRGSAQGENLQLLMNQMARFAVDFTTSLPSIAFKALPRAVTKIPSVNGIQGWLYDSNRLLQSVVETTVLTEKERAEKAARREDEKARKEAEREDSVAFDGDKAEETVSQEADQSK